MPELVATCAVLVVLLGMYASWTAQRLNRLHARVDAAAAALDRHLLRRARAALDLARADATVAAAAPLDDLAEAAFAVTGLGHDREIVENELSRALTTLAPGAYGTQAGQELAEAATRAAFARRFHNDAVRDALEVRGRRVVRYLRLAGHARLPAYFEIDEAPVGFPTAPAALSPYD